MAVWAEYPGVTSMRSAYYTRTLGTDPDIILCRFNPNQSVPPAVGNFVFHHDGQAITMRNCCLDFASLEMTANGHVVTARFFDPRIWWRDRDITGYYNTPRGERADTGRLAVLLLQAMGLRSYNVAALPVDFNYPVDWVCADARLELDELCAAYGCAVSMTWGGAAKIVRMGTGTQPPTANRRSVSYGFDVQKLPDIYRVCAGEAVVDSKLKLRAVMPEPDGTLVDADDVSYKPTDGWGTEDPFEPLNVQNPSHRKLAARSLWRYYVVESQADGTNNIPGLDVVADAGLITLRTTRLGTYEDAGVERKNRPTVTGRYAIGTLPDPLATTAEGTEYDGGFTIVPDANLVIFRDPVFLYDTTTNQRSAADLNLRTSYTVADPDTFQTIHWKYDRQVAQNGYGTRVLRVDNLQVELIAEYDNIRLPKTVTSVTSNEASVIDTSNELIQRAIEAAGGGQSYMVVFNGMVRHDTDGLARQVTIDVSRRGMFTTVAQNSEPETGVARIRERALRRRLLRMR